MKTVTKTKVFASEKLFECDIVLKSWPIGLTWCTWVLNPLLWYFRYRFPLLSVDCKCCHFLAVGCSHFKHVHDCLTVQIFPVTGQSSQGKGYLLVDDVSSWRCFLSSMRIFFVKRQKIEIVPQLDLFNRCINNAMCYYTRRSSLTWLVLHTEGKICSVMWCAVQYSHMIHIHNSVKFHLFHT